MVIREAVTDDAEQIAQVHIDSWKTTYAGIFPDSLLQQMNYEQRADLWRQTISSAKTEFVYVAVTPKGEVVGFASGGPERSHSTSYAGELYSLYLLQRDQRKGIGAKLVSQIAARLQSSGCDTMIAWVLEQNPACHFYKALGGRVVDQKVRIRENLSFVEVAYGWDDIRQL